MKHSRTMAAAIAALSMVGLLAGTTVPAGAAANGGTLKVLSGSFPDSLDPSFGYTTQFLEAGTQVYIPLLTYAHKSGLAGTQLIPGLAKALPTVTGNGMVYNLTLRKGLTYSDGTPIKASDFAFGIERSIKLHWGGDSFFTQYIKGADAFASGTATSISGITTNDATGAITVTLTQAYGAFANVLAFEAAAPLPPNTPMKVQSTNPPVGDGPYKFGKIAANASYTLVKNPRFAGEKLPGIPVGNVGQIDVALDSNNITEAQQVINNQADVFDPADTLPPAELSAARALPKNRYQPVAAAETNYVFLNTQIAPFNKLAVRQAVDMAIDRTALARLAAGFSVPACYLLPPNFPGHPSAKCASGNPAVSPSAATIKKAKSMIAKAGDAGASVTVWSQTKQPRQAYMTYYTGLLNQLGFKATLKTIQDSIYFQQIGAASNKAQTGFADWSQDFPNPADFYLLLDARTIQSTNNENFGNVNDPHIQSVLQKLDAVPASKLDTVTNQWAALEQYVNQKAYNAPFGNEELPLLFSNRVTNGPASFNSVFYIDWASIKLG